MAKYIKLSRMRSLAETRSEKYTEWIVAHKPILLQLIVIVSLAAIWQVRSLEFAGDIGSYVDGSSEDLETYLDYTEKFGRFESFVFVVRAPDVLAPNVLQSIRFLTEKLKRDIDIDRVISITNLPIELTDELLSNPFLLDYLLLPSGRQTQVLAMVDASEIDVHSRMALARRLQDVAENMSTQEMSVGVTGPSVIANDVIDLSRRDFERIVWLVPAILGIVILLVFQLNPIVLAPVVIFSLAALWTLAAFVLFGNKLNMMTTMVPVIIAVITFADVIHILHKYYLEASHSQSREKVVLKTMGLMNGACLMTSVTTALGFIALLLVSPIGIVKAFTLWAAIGVLIAYVLTVVLMPIIISIIPLPGVKAQLRYAQMPINGLVAGISVIAKRKSRAVPLFIVITGLLFAWASTELDVETDIRKLLPASLPSIEVLNTLQAGIDGADSLEVVIELTGSSFDDPEEFIVLENLETRLLENFDQVVSIRSITDALAGLHVQAGQAGFPTNSNVVEEYLLVLDVTADEEWLRSFISEDFSSVRLSLQVEHDSSSRTLELLSEIDRWLVANSPVAWDVKTTGPLKLLVISARALLDSQLLSFLVAMLFITAAMYAFLRDRVLAGISLVVNFLPVLITMGLFPLLIMLGVVGSDAASLNVSTVMVPSLAMAIAVDDTVHFLVQYRSSIVAGDSVQSAIERALKGAGFAMIVTTIAMVLGFSALFFSEMSANREFAAMMCVALIVAVLADLFLLPQLVQKYLGPGSAKS